MSLLPAPQGGLPSGSRVDQRGAGKRDAESAARDARHREDRLSEVAVVVGIGPRRIEQRAEDRAGVEGGAAAAALGGDQDRRRTLLRRPETAVRRHPAVDRRADEGLPPDPTRLSVVDGPPLGALEGADVVEPVGEGGNDEQSHQRQERDRPAGPVREQREIAEGGHPAAEEKGHEILPPDLPDEFRRVDDRGGKDEEGKDADRRGHGAEERGEEAGAFAREHPPPPDDIGGVDRQRADDADLDRVEDVQDLVDLGNVVGRSQRARRRARGEEDDEERGAAEGARHPCIDHARRPFRRSRRRQGGSTASTARAAALWTGSVQKMRTMTAKPTISGVLLISRSRSWTGGSENQAPQGRGAR